MNDFRDIARRSGRRASPGDRGGFVLPVVLMLLMVLSTVTVFFLITGSDQQRAGRAMRESARAFYAADAGLNLVLAEWDSLQYDTLMTTTGDSVVLDWRTLDNGDSYRARLIRVDGDTLPSGLLFSVDVTGRGAGGGQRSLAMILVKSDVFFQQPLYGLGYVSLSGGDIYGDVGSNGSIAVSNNRTVYGDAAAVDSVFGNGVVTGTSTDGAPPQTFPLLACPTTPYGPGFSGPGKNFNSVTGVQNISGQNDATFTDGTYFFSNFSKTSQGDLIIPAGATVHIFISDTLTITGTGFTNHNGAANSLQIWACGTSSPAWAINAQTNVSMTVYAPNRRININGQGDRFGAFIADTLNKGGNGNVTFDPALAGSGGYGVLSGSWTQRSR